MLFIYGQSTLIDKTCEFYDIKMVFGKCPKKLNVGLKQMRIVYLILGLTGNRISTPDLYISVRDSGKYVIYLWRISIVHINYFSLFSRLIAAV